MKRTVTFTNSRSGNNKWRRWISYECVLYSLFSPLLSSFVRRLNSLFFLFARWLFVMGSTCSSNSTNEQQQKKNTLKEIIIKIKKERRIYDTANRQSVLWLKCSSCIRLDEFVSFWLVISIHTQSKYSQLWDDFTACTSCIFILLLVGRSVGWFFFSSYSYSFKIVQQIIRSYNGMELWLVVYS